MRNTIIIIQSNGNKGTNVRSTELVSSLCNVMIDIHGANRCTSDCHCDIKVIGTITIVPFDNKIFFADDVVQPLTDGGGEYSG